MTDHEPWDELIMGWQIKETEHWLVHVTPMLFNHRILLTSHDEYPLTWTAGWCYDTRVAAVVAAAVFEPETEMDPAGFKRLAADLRRSGKEIAEINRRVADGD